MKPALRQPLLVLGLLGVFLLSGSLAWAKITVTPSTIDFGSVQVGSSASATVNVKGTGGVPSNKVTVTIPSGQPFSATPSSFKVKKGKDVSVTVTFSPTTTGSASSNISFNSHEVTVVGLGIPVPTATATGPTVTATATGSPGSPPLGGGDVLYLPLLKQPF